MKSTRAISKRGGIRRVDRSGNITVSLIQLRQAGPAAKKKIIQQVQKILQAEKKKGQVEIILAGDALLKRLNREFAGKNKTTDVLSFSFEENITPQKGLHYIGEIYISLEQAQKQAKEYAVTLQEELLRLVTHGTLHLLGYDHKKKDEAKLMRNKEEYLNAR